MKLTGRAVLVFFGMLVTAAPGFGGQALAGTQARQHRDAAALQELVLRDGSRLYGAVERETDDEIVFRTQAGAVMTVRRADVVSLRGVTGAFVDGEFWRGDPNPTRLFFTSTGRALGRGHVTAGVYGIVIPFVQVGVTDRFSIGGGSPLVFGFGEGWDRPFWVTPKLQVYSGERADVAVGTLHIFTGGSGGGGIAYGVGTFGRRDASITVGAGMTYTGFDGGGGVVMIGGERQVSRSMKLLTENYIWSGGHGIASAGVRFFGERLSADIGFAVPVGADMFFLFPVVNFVYVW
ncbi:MAG: hypothetical protein H0X67_01755 [Acidobacteria bacterium]|nr:hypothetical protein [Acidobacteriota bacterium]